VRFRVRVRVRVRGRGRGRARARVRVDRDAHHVGDARAAVRVDPLLQLADDVGVADGGEHLALHGRLAQYRAQRLVVLHLAVGRPLRLGGRD